MSTTYFLTGSGTLVDDAPATTTQDITTAVAETIDTDYDHADAPSTDGVTGDYAAAIVISTASPDHQISVAWARLNSGGTPQNTSSFTSEQTSAVGTLNFSASSVDLGTWAAGDRLRIIVRTRDTRSMGGGTRTTTYDIGSAGSTTTAPWTAAAEPVVVTLASATASFTAQAVSPTLAAVGLQLTPTAVTVAAQAVSPTTAAAAVTLSSVALTFTGQALSPQAPVAVPLSPATLNVAAQPLSPTAGGVTAELAPTSVTLTAEALSPTPAAAIVALSPATVTTSGQALTPTVAALTVTLTPVVLDLAAQTLQPSGGGGAVQLASAAVTFEAQQLAPVQPVVLTAANLTVEAQGLSPTVAGAPVVVTAAPATVNLAAVVLTLGGAVDQVDRIVIDASVTRPVVPGSKDYQRVEASV